MLGRDPGHAGAECRVDAGLQLDRDPGRAARALADFVDDAAGLRQAGRAARRLAEERYAQPLLVARENPA